MKWCVHHIGVLNTLEGVMKPCMLLEKHEIDTLMRGGRIDLPDGVNQIRAENPVITIEMIGTVGERAAAGKIRRAKLFTPKNVVTNSVTPPTFKIRPQFAEADKKVEKIMNYLHKRGPSHPADIAAGTSLNLSTVRCCLQVGKHKNQFVRNKKLYGLRK